MSTRGNYSHLLDPLILETDVTNAPSMVWNKFKNINWLHVSINYILPFVVFLFVAFTLKARYDHKKQLD